MTVRVKICGITNLADAAAAVCAGADALGFVFYRASPRFIEPAAVAAIIRDLPPFVSKVGVFVDAEPSSIRRVVEAIGGDGVITQPRCRRSERHLDGAPGLQRGRCQREAFEICSNSPRAMASKWSASIVWDGGSPIRYLKKDT